MNSEEQDQKIQIQRTKRELIKKMMRKFGVQKKFIIEAEAESLMREWDNPIEANQELEEELKTNLEKRLGRNLKKEDEEKKKKEVEREAKLAEAKRRREEETKRVVESSSSEEEVAVPRERPKRWGYQEYMRQQMRMMQTETQSGEEDEEEEDEESALREKRNSDTTEQYKEQNFVNLGTESGPLMHDRETTSLKGQKLEQTMNSSESEEEIRHYIEGDRMPSRQRPSPESTRESPNTSQEIHIQPENIYYQAEHDSSQEENQEEKSIQEEEREYQSEQDSIANLHEPQLRQDSENTENTENSLLESLGHNRQSNMIDNLSKITKKKVISRLSQQGTELFNVNKDQGKIKKTQQTRIKRFRRKLQSSVEESPTRTQDSDNSDIESPYPEESATAVDPGIQPRQPVRTPKRPPLKPNKSLERTPEPGSFERRNLKRPSDMRQIREKFKMRKQSQRMIVNDQIINKKKSRFSGGSDPLINDVGKNRFDRRMGDRYEGSAEKIGEGTKYSVLNRSRETNHYLVGDSRDIDYKDIRKRYHHQRSKSKRDIKNLQKNHNRSNSHFNNYMALLNDSKTTQGSHTTDGQNETQVPQEFNKVSLDEISRLDEREKAHYWEQFRQKEGQSLQIPRGHEVEIDIQGLSLEGRIHQQQHKKHGFSRLREEKIYAESEGFKFLKKKKNGTKKHKSKDRLIVEGLRAKIRQSIMKSDSQASRDMVRIQKKNDQDCIIFGQCQISFDVAESEISLDSSEEDPLHDGEYTDPECEDNEIEPYEDDSDREYSEEMSANESQAMEMGIDLYDKPQIEAQMDHQVHIPDRPSEKVFHIEHEEQEEVEEYDSEQEKEVEPDESSDEGSYRRRKFPEDYETQREDLENGFKKFYKERNIEIREIERSSENHSAVADSQEERSERKTEYDSQGHRIEYSDGEESQGLGLEDEDQDQERISSNELDGTGFKDGARGFGNDFEDENRPESLRSEVVSEYERSDESIQDEFQTPEREPNSEQEELGESEYEEGYYQGPQRGLDWVGDRPSLTRRKESLEMAQSGNIENSFDLQDSKSGSQIEQDLQSNYETSQPYSQEQIFETENSRLSNQDQGKSQNKKTPAKEDKIDMGMTIQDFKDMTNYIEEEIQKSNNITEKGSGKMGGETQNNLRSYLDESDEDCQVRLSVRDEKEEQDRKSANTNYDSFTHSFDEISSKKKGRGKGRSEPGNYQSENGLYEELLSGGEDRSTHEIHHSYTSHEEEANSQKNETIQIEKIESLVFSETDSNFHAGEIEPHDSLENISKMGQTGLNMSFDESLRKLADEEIEQSVKENIENILKEDQGRIVKDRNANIDQGRTDGSLAERICENEKILEEQSLIMSKFMDSLRQDIKGLGVKVESDAVYNEVPDGGKGGSGEPNNELLQSEYETEQITHDKLEVQREHVRETDEEEAMRKWKSRRNRYSDRDTNTDVGNDFETQPTIEEQRKEDQIQIIRARKRRFWKRKNRLRRRKKRAPKFEQLKSKIDIQETEKEEIEMDKQLQNSDRISRKTKGTIITISESRGQSKEPNSEQGKSTKVRFKIEKTSNSGKNVMSQWGEEENENFDIIMRLNKESIKLLESKNFGEIFKQMKLVESLRSSCKNMQEFETLVRESLQFGSLKRKDPPKMASIQIESDRPVDGFTEQAEQKMNFGKKKNQIVDEGTTTGRQEEGKETIRGSEGSQLSRTEFGENKSLNKFSSDLDSKINQKVKIKKSFMLNRSKKKSLKESEREIKQDSTEDMERSEQERNEKQKLVERELRLKQLAEQRDREEREMERKREIQREREIKKEIERQKELELNLKRESELKLKKEREIEKLKEIERAKELERQKELKIQDELDKQRQNIENIENQKRSERELLIRKTPVPNEINIGEIFREMQSRGSIQHFKPVIPTLEQMEKPNQELPEQRFENDLEIDLKAILELKNIGKVGAPLQEHIFAKQEQDEEEYEGSLNRTELESFHLNETQVLEQFKFLKDLRVEEERRRGPVNMVEKSNMGLGNAIRHAGMGIPRHEKRNERAARKRRKFKPQQAKPKTQPEGSFEKKDDIMKYNNYLEIISDHKKVNENPTKTKNQTQDPPKQKKRIKQREITDQKNNNNKRSNLEMPPIKPSSKPQSSRVIPKRAPVQSDLPALDEPAEIFISLQPDQKKKNQPQMSERKIPIKRGKSGMTKSKGGNKDFLKRKKQNVADLDRLKNNSKQMKTMGDELRHKPHVKLDGTLPTTVKRNFDLKRLNKRIKNLEIGSKGKAAGGRKPRVTAPAKKKRKKSKMKRRGDKAPRKKEVVESRPKIRDKSLKKKKPSKSIRRNSKNPKMDGKNPGNMKYRKKFFMDTTQEILKPKLKQTSRGNSKARFKRGGSKKKISRQNSRAGSRKSSRHKSSKKNSKNSSVRKIAVKSKQIPKIQKKKRTQRIPISRRPKRSGRNSKGGKPKPSVNRGREKKVEQIKEKEKEKEKIVAPEVKIARYKIMKEMYGKKPKFSDDPEVKPDIDDDIDIEKLRNQSSFQEFKQILKNQIYK